jgi:hypothetical protein
VSRNADVRYRVIIDVATGVPPKPDDLKRAVEGGQAKQNLAPREGAVGLLRKLNQFSSPTFIPFERIQVVHWQDLFGNATFHARLDLTRVKRSFSFKKGCSRNRYDAIASKIVITSAVPSTIEDRIAAWSALLGEPKVVFPIEPSAFQAPSIASMWNT